MTDVTADDEPLSFTDYAKRIGKSRPYVSNLVIRGVIHGPALSPERKIIPAIADEQRAASAVRAPVASSAPAGTLNAERLRLTAEQANRAQMENAARRGELIERRALAAVLPPLARRYADTIAQQVRDTITDDVERARLMDAIHAATTSFITEALADGGAEPAAA